MELQQLTEGAEMWRVGWPLASATSSFEMPITTTLTSSPDATSHLDFLLGEGRASPWSPWCNPAGALGDPAFWLHPPLARLTVHSEASEEVQYRGLGPGLLRISACVLAEAGRRGDGGTGNQATEPGRMEDVLLSLLAWLCRTHCWQTADVETLLCDQAPGWLLWSYGQPRNVPTLTLRCLPSLSHSLLMFSGSIIQETWVQIVLEPVRTTEPSPLLQKFILCWS